MPTACRMVACRSWMLTGSRDDARAEVVGLAVGEAGLDPAAGHPHGVAARVVVATEAGGGGPRVVGGAELAVDGAAELAAPDDEGVVEHAAPLEVLDEGRRALVDLARLPRQAGWAGRCGGPSRCARASRSARRAPPGAAPAGSWRRRCRAGGRPRRRARRCSPARWTHPSARARRAACARPSRTARCGPRSPGRRSPPAASGSARPGRRGSGGGRRCRSPPDWRGRGPGPARSRT